MKLFCTDSPLKNILMIDFENLHKALTKKRLFSNMIIRKRRKIFRLSLAKPGKYSIWVQSIMNQELKSLTERIKKEDGETSQMLLYFFYLTLSIYFAIVTIREKYYDFKN